MTGTAMLGRIGQVSVTVSDIGRATAFYRDVLGLPHLYTFGQLAFFDCEGTRLFLDALPEAQEQGTSVLYISACQTSRRRPQLCRRRASRSKENLI